LLSFERSQPTGMTYSRKAQTVSAQADMPGNGGGWFGVQLKESELATPDGVPQRLFLEPQLR
jgi:hypothetical protein